MIRKETPIEEILLEAMDHAGVSLPIMIGEGAWHMAWKVTKEDEELVLRIPKKVAYGKPVSFDQDALTAEYSATKWYYESVNQMVPGGAPAFFKFHVTPELTYTLESFGGKSLPLREMSLVEALRVGRQIGALYRKMESLTPEIEGFGRLAWTENKGLHGIINEEFQTFFQETSLNHAHNHQKLVNAYPMFQNNRVEDALQVVTTNRNRRIVSARLVNQDVSPENILWGGDSLCLIDPYPIVYEPREMAGNFMNLYETLFRMLANTPRYKKHQFEKCDDILKAIATGFLDGYSDGDLAISREVRGEQYLQLLETAYQHHCLLIRKLTSEDIIRYGHRKEIEERLAILGDEIKQFAETYFS